MTNPPTDPKDPLAVYWTKSVSELVDVENTKISSKEAERHTINALLVMAVVADSFNGNKKGATGTYPQRAGQTVAPGRYEGDDFGDRYFGHNIACIAVDGRGEVIDFEFNHNELYNSSAEHAEARLIRRIFNLNRAFDHWQTVDQTTIKDVPYGSLLSAVTLYTSLESCAQCSGIMTLANIKSVIYLQGDPGQYRIGNVMYNLSNPLEVSHPYSHPDPTGKPATKYWAPEPIGADLFGFGPKNALEAAYQAFVSEVVTKPFFTATDGKIDKSNSITSFLCTDAAKGIFEAGAADLEAFQLSFPDYAPALPGSPLPVLTNRAVLDQAKRFRNYVKKAARRGTPHR